MPQRQGRRERRNEVSRRSSSRHLPSWSLPLPLRSSTPINVKSTNKVNALDIYLCTSDLLNGDCLVSCIRVQPRLRDANRPLATVAAGAYTLLCFGCRTRWPNCVVRWAGGFLRPSCVNSIAMKTTDSTSESSRAPGRCYNLGREERHTASVLKVGLMLDERLN